MSGIQWTNNSWNPVRGCARVSSGCFNCYAERYAWRFSYPGKPYEDLVRKVNGHPTWNGKIRLVPEKIAEPLHWRKPRRVFVNSMSDLFHEGVPFEFIDRVFAVMAAARQHTFQLLTKRPERMLAYLVSQDRDDAIGYAAMMLYEEHGDPARGLDRAMTLTHRQGYEPRVRKHWYHCPPQPRWPLPNVHLGVSVEDQDTADERIPLLLDTPATVRWVSYEPALETADLSLWLHRGDHWLAEIDPLTASMLGQGERDGTAWVRPNLDWIVVGGESGPGARPCDVALIRSTVEQCRKAGVPCFVKQLGAHVLDRNDAGFDGDDIDDWPCETETGKSEMYQGAPCRIMLNNRKGAAPSEWPEDLRVREYPA